MERHTFASLGLSPEILKAVDKLGFEEASPIQAAAIPELLAGCDVVGQSQTGSGKTAAFAIPAIEKTDPALHAVQVLVLCPTRELATQVAGEVHKLSAGKRGVHAVPVYGGSSFERQAQELKRGAQIVLGTPGRIIDHLERGTLKLDRLRFIVLDEADRMLDMGFRDDIKKILDAMPDDRQTAFFSATVSPLRARSGHVEDRPEEGRRARYHAVVLRNAAADEIRRAPTVDRFPYLQVGHHFLQHAAHGGRIGRRPAGAGHTVRPSARRHRAGAAHARDEQIQSGRIRFSRGDRRGGARDRRG
jgi:hypothetical protein